MMMEQSLIRFAKVHGYITAFLVVCSGVGLVASFAAHLDSTDANDAKDASIIFVIIILILSLINSSLLIAGCVDEDASWLKHVDKFFHIVTGGTFLFILYVIPYALKNFKDRIYLTGATLATFAVSLYGIYLVSFLKKLFNTLKLLRVGIIAITTIICEDSPQPVRPGLPDCTLRPPPPIVALPPPPPPHRSTAAPAAATTNTTAAPKPKEFPTWK